jgi:hypothetical protein
MVQPLIGKLSDEEVRMLVLEIATTSNRDFLLILKNKVSIDSAIDFVDSWLRTSGFVYRRQSNAIGTYSFVIHHDLGRKWSLYQGELYKHLFEECKATGFNYDARDSMLSFTVEA